MSARATAVRWALAAMAGYALIAGLSLANAGGNPEWFIHFGHESTVLPKGRQVLGPAVLVPHDQGQDGQTFWLQARDPLLLHPDDALRYEDRPAYRSQRVLYPLLVAPARLLGERAMVWGLLLVNLVAVGIGAGIASLLAAEVGAPQRAVVAYVLNPAVVVAFLMDAADVVAITVVLAGLLAWSRRRWPAAVACFAVAALTREITLLVPLALAATTVREAPRRSAVVAAVPVAVAAGWGVYVRARLDWPATKVQEFAFPLTGFREAWELGWAPFGDWGHAAVAIGLGVVMLGVPLAWWRRRNDLLLGALPFAALYPLLSGQVLNLAVNSVRAVGPALTLLPLGLYARRRP